MRVQNFAVLVLVVTILCFTFFALGRAMDVEAQDRVIFTRGGVTFDCERRYVPAGEVIPYEDGSSVRARAGGEVTYGNCHDVP